MTPGTYITFTSISGGVTNDPNSSDDTPTGDTGWVVPGPRH